MTDHFALLNEPRRPWLEPELLKAKFLKLAAEAHPDKQHGSSEAEKSPANRRYAELSAAYNCLAEPKSRLLRPIELELGAKPKDVQQIPPPPSPICSPKWRRFTGMPTVFSLKKARWRRRCCKSSCLNAGRIGLKS